jgi:hypothetical protein
MKRSRLALGSGLVCLALGAGAFAALGALSGNHSLPPPAPRVPRAAEKHYVTLRQLAESGAMARVTVALPDAVDHNGKSVDWQSLLSQRPLVVVFIKDGCPCNVDFEPYFQRLATAYPDEVGFVGVIDADVPAAKRYVDANRVRYPVIADPARAIVGTFKAENGAYVALVSRGGVVDAMWPGCSVEVMRDLNGRIARLAQVDERSVDFTGLPNAMTTGCPFSPSNN